MKKVFHKIASVLLATLVLFSTLSFTVDMHYCGSRLVDVALFKEAKSCGMEQMQKLLSCGDTVKKKSCCKDKQVVIEGQDDLKDTVTKLTLDQEVFATSYIYTYQNIAPDVISSITSFIGHSPPIPDKDFQVLYETFLI
ncbi:hypothetical protein ABW636_04745 [Aquimarina sp. 2201CG1-2-11]|uniref:HYC_CC_PP family protein n=1 Tax=Aquimarina discodermiae TaxID=3231043 RepID=UPI0034636EEF